MTAFCTPNGRSCFGKSNGVAMCKNLSQMALAEKIDKSPSYINHLENGNRSMGLDTFVQIVTALDQSADWFLGIQTTPLSLRDCSRQDQRLILEMVTALKSALQERDAQ